MVPLSARSSFLVISAALAQGCGSSQVPGPDEPPSAAEATGRFGAKAVSGRAKPLIVDWTGEERADLEEALHDGIAVLAWSDEGLRLLSGCRLDGQYGYMPVALKKDVVRLESAQEVAANLPFGGAGIAAKLEAELKQGMSLEIAMAMVGKRRTTWNDVTDKDLLGGSKCGGATHYVRAVLVGAFAMQSGSKASARAAVEIFGAGASGSTLKNKGIQTADGELARCEASQDDDAKSPPKGCAALLRVELEPIGHGESAPKAADAKKEAAAAEAETCQPGFVWSEGKCASAASDPPRLCEPTDAADCEKQCGKGDADSCNNLGFARLNDANAKPADFEAAFKKACDGGSATGCTNLGFLRLTGERGASVDQAAGLKLLEAACTQGSEIACTYAGSSFAFGENGVTKDVKRGARLLTRGCDGGSYDACTTLGVLYISGGNGLAADGAKATEYGKRACQGGVSVACGNLGAYAELGILGHKKDLALATTYFDRACRMNPSECFRSAILHQQGEGVKKDLAKAKELFTKSCEAPNPEGLLGLLSCHLGPGLYSGTKRADPASLERVITVLKPQCDANLARACSFVGVAELALGRKPSGDGYLQTACTMKDKDAWACDLRKRFGSK